MCSKKYLITATIFVLCSVAHSNTCKKGHKFEKEKGVPVCLDCDPGTFMPEDSHNKTECYPCSTVRDSGTEVLLRECSREEDALIACKPGFFKDGNTCEACKVCETEHEIQACYGNVNTVCCPSARFYIHIDSSGVKVCRMRTLPCKQGQFFVSGKKCKPCQPGTYMVKNHHKNTACSSCQHISEKQEIDVYVASACNSTAVHHGQAVNMTYSITDQALDVISVILLILGLIVLLGLLLVKVKLVKHMAASSKQLSPVMNCLADHQLTLVRCVFILFTVLIVYFLGILIARLVNPVVGFDSLMMFLIAVCFFVLAVLIFLLCHRLFQKASQDCTSSPFL